MPAQRTLCHRVIAFVADRYKITPRKLKSRSRPNDIVWPRWIAMLLIRKHSKLTLAAIGQQFGRHHGTVLNGIRRLPDLASTSSHHLADWCEAEQAFDALSNNHNAK